MYEFLNSANAAEYERFVEAHENGLFMQSLAWANVKANWENEAVISRDERSPGFLRSDEADRQARRLPDTLS